jgi:hypothetical protein
MKKEKELFLLCKNFVKDMQISCSETIYQSDKVIEEAYELIEQICEIVGYHEIQDE